MEIYHWEENGKNWFAIEGDTDDFFIEVVEYEMILNDQKESADWITFWVGPQHATIIKKKYPVQYEKPITDIDQFNHDALAGFKKTELELEKDFANHWGVLEPLNVDLKNVNKQADEILRKHVKESFNSPRQSDGESSIPTGNFIYREEDFE